MTVYYISICLIMLQNVTRILLVKFELNWSILKILTFEPLYDPLMTFCNMAYVLLCLKCHMHTFIQVWAIEAFWKFCVSYPFLTTLKLLHLTCLKCHMHTFSQVSAQLEHIFLFLNPFVTPYDILYHSICLQHVWNLTRIIFKKILFKYKYFETLPNFCCVAAGLL